MKLTKADVNELQVNAAWLDIVERMEKMLEQADKDIENPDSFFHGRAVGARETLRTLVGLPTEQLRIVENRGEVATKLR